MGSLSCLFTFIFYWWQMVIAEMTIGQDVQFKDLNACTLYIIKKVVILS